MSIARSISVQLVLAFTVILFIAMGLGAVGLLGTRAIAGKIETTAQTALPAMMVASELEVDAARVESMALSYFFQNSVLPETEERLAFLLERLSSALETQRNAELHSRYESLVAAIDLAVQRHAAEVAMRVEVGDENLTIVQFLKAVKLGNADYVTAVGEASRFGVFDGLNTDPGTTAFAAFAKSYVAPDEAFADLLAAYGEAEAKVIDYVSERIVTAGSAELAEAQFVRMSSRRLPRMTAALDAAIEAATERYGALQSAKKDAQVEMRAALVDFVEKVDEQQRSALGDMNEAVSEAQDLSTTVTFVTTVALAVGAILAAAICIAAVRKVGPPIRAITEAITALGERKFDIPIPFQNRRDEVGRLSRTAEEFRHRLADADALSAAQEAERQAQEMVVQRLSRSMRALSDGDLSETIETQFPPAYEQLRADFNTTVMNMNGLLAQIAASVSEVEGRATEIGDAAQDLSARTESQAATLEQTAAAMDQLTTSVRAAAESAAAVEDQVTATRSGAEENAEAVREAVQAMAAIKKSSEGIVQIISVIDDIAFQTNLLALNAGVEAARAGESGRGFAVVASEVRNLAQKSSDAAQQIKALINESVDQVSGGVRLVNNAGEALDQIVERVTHIEKLVSGIANAAQEQALGLGEVNEGVVNLDRVTQQNAAMVQQSTVASQMLKQKGDVLSGLVERFRLMPQSRAERATPHVRLVG
ncbi:methyl-accepting chemotaxis protein [Tropicibacter sp. S64]|uniref:methyl-accepting chemotaxis protein n=1 Tax=Tropicibacter sp. S64 TaxID=3415122 RepID=UPI003C7DD2CE